MRHNTRRHKRRRSCYDRARNRLLRARRAQRNNPAASAALQMLGIFGFLFGRMPIATPAPYVAPPMLPRQEQRNEIARRLGVPTRYLDVVLNRGSVPYALLNQHIRLGGATQRDALNELRKIIPVEALDWLDYVEKHGLWSDLSRCVRVDASDEDIEVQLLKAALAWAEAKKMPADSTREPIETKHGLEPPKPRQNEDPDDEPTPPKF